MTKYSLEQFLDIVRNERAARLSPYELVYKSFLALGYDKQNKDYFMENASEIVTQLRDACWTNYLPEEELFTSEMLKLLIPEKDFALSPQKAIEEYLDAYPAYLYQLCLSNTQSRRSRAGKEFEAIIELLLMGARIPLDSQGNIGKKIFVDKGLGKLVDVVSPGVVEYVVDKNYTLLISAKTTLRERWQEVPEEMNRTGAREMFLATLDERISSEVLNTLKEANIRVTTTKDNKNRNYPKDRQVIDFERLLELCVNNQLNWTPSQFSEEEAKMIEDNINSQIEKHARHPFVIEFYEERKQWLKG